MSRDSFRFILTTGDNSQGQGTYQQFDSRVFHIYRDVFSKAAIFPTIGNHDYLTDNGAPYLDLFDLPRNAWRTNDIQRYYSFDYGNVHFVVLDSKALLDADDAAASDGMFAWLCNDLSQTAQRWKIVTCHHPPYSTGSYGSNRRVQTQLVPIFETYGVDLVLSGHQHNYQRSKPLRGGQVTTVEEGGIVYIVSGAGAAAKHACDSADWLAFSICSVSYGLSNRITVTRDRLIIETVDDGGKVRDIYTLSKD
jgi:3',5'-cyclic AMP phosphodiesterase CpdA